MMPDEPRRGFGFFTCEPEARTEMTGDTLTGNRVILSPALCNIVQQGCHVEGAPAFQCRENFGSQGMLVRECTLFNRRQCADRANEMLVHCEVMIHVELHHGDDAAEFRNEAAQHTSLIHHAQQDFRRIAVCEHIHEQCIGFGIFADIAVNGWKRQAHRFQSVGMNFCAMGAGN